MHVRPALPADAARVAAIYAPYVTHRGVSFEEAPPDAAEMAARMAKLNGLFPWLVAEQDAEVLGYAYAGSFRARAAYRFAVETTVYVAEEAHRRGVGRLLYRHLLATLRAQGFTQAIAIIALPNHASVRLHESFGFEAVGLNRRVGWKDGHWVDVGIWQLELCDSGAAPTEPQPFSATGTP
ncbi:arsinothricin resistance N-acetyltransferase ArsN1 family B [Sphingomonas sp. ID1715]|uniref:arsinothricin resistance N-acetyltransferase ArsN1 family B n=1 Tax=Sphingomonas sp. ID1715 TaxID=1656898 RepID=UPI0020C489A9|nr:arsinothricin resistance N-acetyltransferase ArsN1 family B [Sphingomonas sp. ID1715]